MRKKVPSTMYTLNKYQNAPILVSYSVTIFHMTLILMVQRTRLCAILIACTISLGYLKCTIISYTSFYGMKS